MTKARNNSTGALTVGSTGLTLGSTTTSVAGLTLTTSTFTSPTVNNSTDNYPRLTSPKEFTTVSATAATGTIQFDVLTQGILYYTSAAVLAFTLNVRGNSGTTLASLLGTGDAVTIVFMNTNTATAYYTATVTIDGNAQTVKWQGGTAPTAGNINSVDAYTFTIIKTAATPTYTVIGSQTKFA